MKNSDWKIIFMGTSRFAAEILDSLLKKDYAIAALFTQPDKKIGRKQELVSSPVKLVGLEKNIPVFQPDKLSTEEIAIMKNFHPDVIIVAAYGKILPETVLAIPKFGCLNVHASLLPNYRGASPIQNALLNGEQKTGNTLMLMDQGLDTGAILAQNEIAIETDDTAESLTEKLARSGAELLLQALPEYLGGKITPRPQADSAATVCRLIKRADGLIDWNDTAEKIYNKYRAFQPWPGIFSFWQNNHSPKRIKLIKIKLVREAPGANRVSGEIFKLDENVAIQTGAGALILESVQLEGKSPVSTKEFIQGHPHFIRGKLQ